MNRAYARLIAALIPLLALTLSWNVYGSSKSDLLFQPSHSFEIVQQNNKKTVTFLAGEALVKSSNKVAGTQFHFVYGKILLQRNSTLLISKEDDRYVIQNLNEPVEISFRGGSTVRIEPYYEMVLKRDLSESKSFVIEQLIPLNLKSHLMKFQRITRPKPSELIAYSRSLKLNIQQAKEHFARATQETARRRIASEEAEKELEAKKSRPTKVRKTLRQRYEEKTFGQVLYPST